MKKELLIAVFFGLCAGLIVTYGVYRLFTRPTKHTTVPQTTPSASQEATPESSTVAINSPTDGLIQTETKLTVSGSTIANATVLITTQEEEFFTNSDVSGNFAQSIDLIEGANTIAVHVFDESGTQTTVERTIVVTDTTEPVKEASSSASPSPKPTAKP